MSLEALRHSLFKYLFCYFPKTSGLYTRALFMVFHMGSRGSPIFFFSKKCPSTLLWEWFGIRRRGILKAFLCDLRTVKIWFLHVMLEEISEDCWISFLNLFHKFMKVISLRIFKRFSEVNRRGFFKEGFSKFLLGLFEGISYTYRKDFFF